MLNDIHPPPLDHPAQAQAHANHSREVSTTPLPPPERTIADVTLFDHPAINPSGAGNFWGLAIIGMILLGFLGAVAMFFFLV